MKSKSLRAREFNEKCVLILLFFYKIQKCKASALLKMSRYDEVVKFINSLATAEQKSLLAYEKAYALYRQFKNQEALDAINTATINSPDDKLKVDELRAQILYRLEEFQEAREIYKQLHNVSKFFKQNW